MQYIDEKYVKLISPRLKQFKQTSKSVFNFRCPFCGDSKKSKTKARGYFYPKKGSLLYRCHNCGAGMSIANFLKELDPALYEEYIAEKWKSKFSPQPKTTPQTRKKRTGGIKILKDVKSLSELDSDHPAVKYATERLIPKDTWRDIYYVDKISDIAYRLEKYKNTKFDESPRILFPFRKKDRTITHIQGRAIDNNKLRYVTLEVIPDEPKIFGLNRIDFSKPVIVVEGPIDSLFLKNALAMGGADVDYSMLPKNTIFVYDNEPRNHEMIKRIEKTIKQGFYVCIWDKDVPTEYKDINDMVSLFGSQKEVQRYIFKHAYSGLKASLELTQFKKRV